VTSSAFGRLWPRVAAWGVFLAIVGVLLALSLRANDGQLAYALDDPYIHLALARTLAEHGVWGIAPDAFAPASSSPAWTLLLAALWWGGLRSAWVPFVLNVMGGVAVLWLLERLVRPWFSSGSRAVVLVVTLAVIPLPTLVFTGMEHVWHVAVVLAICGHAALRLEGNNPRPWHAAPLWAAFAVGLRYESLFVVAVIAGLFLIRQRGSDAIRLLGGAAVPVLAYGAFSISQGGLLLPNSVLVKSGAERFASPFWVLAPLADWVNLLFVYQRPAELVLMVGACAAALALSARERTVWTVPLLLPAAFLGIAALHVSLVRMVWFYRYEAYVVTLGVVAVAIAFARMRHHWSAGLVWPVGDHAVQRAGRFAAMGLAVLCGLPLATRAVEALLTTPTATHEIYAQQQQMARFFDRFYAGETIAVNDIGAVAWGARVRVVDLVGLASLDVTDAMRRSEGGTDVYERLGREQGVSAACVYDFYFVGRRALPTSWRSVGEWRIGSRVAVSSPVVTFYATSDAEVPRLRDSLDRFAADLPSSVTYSRRP
jgi:hypothetical protein